MNAADFDGDYIDLRFTSITTMTATQNEDPYDLKIPEFNYGKFFYYNKNPSFITITSTSTPSPTDNYCPPR